MTISKTLQRLAERLDDERVITNPQKYLGPNYKAVLDFWRKLDKLSEDQLFNFHYLYWDFHNNRYPDYMKAAKAASIIDSGMAAQAAHAVWFTYYHRLGRGRFYSEGPGMATLELIGGLEDLIFFKMFDNL